MMTLLSNNSCSKSNCAMDYVKLFPDLDIRIRPYLEQPLSREELQDLTQKLQRPVVNLVRKTDPSFVAQFAEKELNDDELFDLLVQQPELLQRPILIDENTAIIGRPPELILEYLNLKGIK